MSGVVVSFSDGLRLDVSIMRDDIEWRVVRASYIRLWYLRHELASEGIEYGAQHRLRFENP